MDTTVYDDAALVYDENEDPRCNGCNQPIEDGSVVQFGDGIWHFECFHCAKCHKLVECYSNLLLLRDGSPICEDCSYSCHACSKPIKDEAIMTGDEAYHADCFRCTQCDIKIEDLVFTQTSKGIFCTSCHEMRKQMRQKRKEDRLLYQQQNSNIRHLDPHPPSHPLVEETLAADKPPHRGSSLDSHLKHHQHIDDICTSNLRPSNLSREPSASSVVEAYHDRSGLNPNNISLSTEELAELNHMLNSSSMDTTLFGDGSTETIPSPPRTRGSASPSSDTTFRSFNSMDDDVVNVELPSAQCEPPSKRQASLEKELDSAKTRLREVETKFNKIKSISRKALDEFHVVKQGYAAEVTARQESEALVLKLRSELAVFQQASLFGAEAATKTTREELAQLGRAKADLEATCKELRDQRDSLSAAIMNAAINSSDALFSRIVPAQEQQLRSLQNDMEAARANYLRLIKGRDDIINEMIMLNTKNAELSALNNDLSRRVTEREREALAIMAGTSFITDEPESAKPSAEAEQHTTPAAAAATAAATSLERKSSDHQHVRRVAQRDSISHAEPPKMFKFRRNKGGPMFRRRGHSDSKKNGEELISVPYDPSKPMHATHEGTVKEHGSASDLIKLSHSFTQTRFLRPTKCDACGEKMWRVSELKCHDCGYICHYRCMHNVGTTCKRQDGAHGKIIFGKDLAEQIKLEHGQVPLVVQKCIEAVEARGMDFEGIYRKSGAAGQMRMIQQAFEREDTSLDLCDDEQWNDICAVTSVLKQYFRDLPDPLFTHEFHSRFMDAVVNGEQRTQFRQLIHALPVENYNTLKYLMLHLERVQQKSSENLMTSRNLAVVFGPTLMRHSDENKDLVDMNHKINAIDYILSHIPVLFADPAPSQQNHSSPLPKSPASKTTRQHRREMSTDDILRSIPPAVPPRENAGFI
ncbi:hypothetical protein BCR43DRAFT_489534 [Syncephalastrum racemosum]|uniref:RhoGAP-domain-containing protein n=1 Tax=Syncephalastrum racemosum TaxID=13706 RepID=A0A1X2HEB2_SYNRA|nr:hypothetical protein BCR43DRAFT_489534 [Syncephalastrum racemosum]